MVVLEVWDWVGMVLFLVFTIGYHGGYNLYAHRHPLNTVKGKIHLYRRTWVKRILDRGDHFLAVQTVRNLIMGSSFLASSALVVIAVVLNFILNADVQSLNVPHPELLMAKVFLIVVILGYSFLSFLLNIRLLNQFTVLVAADPDLIDHVEGVDAVTYLTNVLNKASTRYTYGQRGFYFTLPVVAWVFSPLAFTVVTLALGLFLVLFLDFKRWQPPRVMRKQVKEVT